MRSVAITEEEDEIRKLSCTHNEYQESEETKQMENPILIHAQESKGKTFGDPRLVKRGQNCTQQWKHIKQ
jgi:hypothetical protein